MRTFCCTYPTAGPDKKTFEACFFGPLSHGSALQMHCRCHCRLPLLKVRLVIQMTSQQPLQPRSWTRIPCQVGMAFAAPKSA